MVEDGADDRRVGDVGQDAPPAAALTALQNVQLERPAEQLGPRQARTPGGGRKLGSRRKGRAGWRGRGWRLGDDAGAKFGVGGKHPVEVNEVGAWRRNEGGQQAEQLQRSQHQVGRAVRRRALEAVGEASILTPGETFQGQRPPGTVPAEPGEAGPVVFMDEGVGVEGKAFEKGAAGLGARWPLSRRRGAGGAGGRQPGVPRRHSRGTRLRLASHGA